MAVTRNLLIAIGGLSLCGLAFISVSAWVSLSPEQQIQIYGRALVFWTCCGGPIAGGALVWGFINRDRFIRRRDPSEEL